ncbi:hypothetical protein [Mucilaginibacter auburnensis]|uniref:Uncharacterized protein n=1 Tax=Mucilaginibacter auburnensis TaxID=1457233 RepID=A0A2H9VRE4_9SPHI|nr:hypothetical protein [Mucilaginibacter auburnensis]PJJ83384.1 hypothetical protein CLV57_0365 [Mucilaginibacter auburnensis]
MKNRKPAISKLVASFDNELRAILMSDLRAKKGTRNVFMKAIWTERLSVA